MFLAEQQSLQNDSLLCSKCNRTFLNQTDREFDQRPFPHMKEVSLSGYRHASIVHYTTRYSVLIASLSLLCLLFSSLHAYVFNYVWRPLPRLVPPSVAQRDSLSPSQRNTVSRPLITRRLCSVGCGFGELGMTS